MVKIIWTHFALDDLKQIHDFISKDSKVYADKVIDQIIELTSQLEKLPLSGRSVPEFQTEILRELIFGRYRIIYRMSSDQISIIRIYHSSRQL
jgi:toxin ParE1/3/4